MAGEWTSVAPSEAEASADANASAASPTAASAAPARLDDHVVFMTNPAEILDPRKHNPYFDEIVTTHAAALLCGVLGNSVVVMVMLGDRKARTATNLFLGSLAAADLLLLLVYGPLEALRYFVLQWDEAGAVCKLARAAQLLSAVASVLNLAAVTLERFLVIVFPMKSRSYCTLSNCRRAVLAVWAVAALLTTPVFLTQVRRPRDRRAHTQRLGLGTYPMIYTNNVTNITVHYCTQTGVVFAIYQFIILFGAPGILMIICYTFVIRELWRSTRSMRVLTNSISMKSVKSNRCPENHSSCLTAAEANASASPDMATHSMCTGEHRFRVARMSETACGRTYSNTSPHAMGPGKNIKLQSKGDDVRKARKQVIKMLILVIVLFLVCWGPCIIMEIFMEVGIETFNSTIYRIRFAVFALPVIHACMNPFIYSFMSKNFRRSLQRQLDRMSCRASSAITSASGAQGPIYGSSRTSRIQQEASSHRGLRIGSRQRIGRGSTSSSTNYNNEITKHTDIEHVLATADV